MTTAKLAVLAALGALSACASAPKTVSAPAASPLPVLRADAAAGGQMIIRTIEDGDPRAAGVVLALLPFKNNSGDKGLDRHSSQLLDLISAELAPRPGFKLVERHRVDDLFREMQLGDGGLVDQATAVRVGGLLGANVIGLGSYSTFGRETKLSLRLVKVETGEIIGGVNETGDGTSELARLAGSAAARIGDALSPRAGSSR